MAAITITSLNPGATEEHTKDTVETTEAVDIGQCMRKDGATGKWQLANASVTTDAANAGRDGVGIAMNKAEANSQVDILRSGKAFIGAAGVTPGKTFAVGGVAAGSIEPDADVDTANYLKTILFATRSTVGSTIEIVMAPVATNVVST